MKEEERIVEFNPLLGAGYPGEPLGVPFDDIYAELAKHMYGVKDADDEIQITI